MHAERHDQVFVLASDDQGDAQALKSVPPRTSHAVHQQFRIDIRGFFPLANNLVRIAVLAVVMGPQAFGGMLLRRPLGHG
jgi:hypothetical protein